MFNFENESIELNSAIFENIIILEIVRRMWQMYCKFVCMFTLSEKTQCREIPTTVHLN